MRLEKINVKDFKTKAFEIILKESLSIQKGSDKPLTVIYDDDFLKLFNSLLNVVTEWNLPTIFIFIPKDYQAMIMSNKTFFDDNNEINLPPQIACAVENSKLILNFLSGDSRYSKIRGAIISLRKQYDAKMVHSPGISEEVLKILNKSPFKKIHKECELLAWALGNSNKCKITSTDKSGNEYTLSFQMDGWENEPFISSGRILENSWGNVPPGESFCCPDINSVQGQICINGSVPGYLLTPNEEVILDFKYGKLTQWSSKGEKVHKYFSQLTEDANKRGDLNWNSFAEFGIGLNPAIKKLVGNPLFDEKMAGTIHVAIGDNTSFGHGVKSFYHDDLVCIKPTVELDDHIVIKKGILNIQEMNKWKSSTLYEILKFNDNDLLTHYPKKMSFEENMMFRILLKGDRKGKVAINRGEFKILQTRFQEMFHEGNVRYLELKKKFKKKEINSLNKMLSLFNHYKIINVKHNEK